MNNLESEEFSARLGVASSLDTLQRALLMEPTFKTLLAATEDTAGQLAAFRRLISLAQTETDRRYLNPYDVAVAAHLFALYQHRSPYLRAAIQVVELEPDFWWAQKMAVRLAAQNAATNDNSSAGTSGLYPRVPGNFARATSEIVAQFDTPWRRLTVISGYALTQQSSGSGTAEGASPRRAASSIAHRHARSADLRVAG